MATRVRTARKTASKSRTAGKTAAKTATKTARKTAAKTAAKKAPARKKAARQKVAPPTPVPLPPAPENDPTLLKAKYAAELALDKKAESVVLLDVRGLSDYAEYVLVATGESEPQVQAIADNITAKMKEKGHRTIGVEGTQTSRWVLIDFGDLVAHVFYQDLREFYDIEGLWADARRIEVEGA